MNTPETIEAEATTEEVVEETTTEEAAEEEQGSGEEEATKAPLQTDYKAKYDDLQKKIAGDAFRFRKEKRGEEKSTESEEDTIDDDAPLTRKEMERILSEREQKTSRKNSLTEATTLARSLVESDDEAQYAAALWEHVQLPFDTMEEQMRFIIGGMNAERLLAQKSELTRAVQSKTLARKDTATTARDATVGNSPKIVGDVKAALERNGFKYEPTKKAWVKTLANGKKMFNDGRGKKWFE